MTLTDRDRKLLLALAVIVLLAGFWYFVYTPKQQKIGDLGGKIAAKQHDLEAVQVQLALSSSAQATYAADYTTVVRLGEAVPDEDAIPSLLVQLDALAGRNVDFSQVGIDKYPDKLLAPSQGSGGDSGTAGQPAPAPAAGGATPPGGGTSGQTPAKDSAQGQQQVQQSNPLGVEPVPVRMQFEGDFFKLHNMIDAIDRLVRSHAGQISVSGRMVFIEGFDVKQGRGGFPQVDINVGALVFALPQGQSLTDGSTVQAPSQSGAQPVSGKSGSASASPTPSAAAGPVKP